MTPHFTTPCYVSIQDADKKKELISKLESIGYKYATIYGIKLTKGEFVKCWDNHFCKTIRNQPCNSPVSTFIDCGTNTELFLALAGMRNDTDKGQWFKLKDNYTYLGELSLRDMFFFPYDYFVINARRCYRLATAQEIIEHFNNKIKTTEKQKCIAEQAVYGDLRVIANNHFNSDRVCGVNSEYVSLRYANGEIPCFHMDKVKPILRPISDLTKPITHKGYNHDKPFVSAQEINILELGSYSICLGQDNLRPGRHIVENDLLNLWHFDTRNLIKKGEAIDVNTLDINPYSI